MITPEMIEAAHQAMFDTTKRMTPNPRLQSLEEWQNWVTQVLKEAVPAALTAALVLHKPGVPGEIGDPGESNDQNTGNMVATRSVVSQDQSTTGETEEILQVISLIKDKGPPLGGGARAVHIETLDRIAVVLRSLVLEVEMRKAAEGAIDAVHARNVGALNDRIAQLEADLAAARKPAMPGEIENAIGPLLALANQLRGSDRSTEAEWCEKAVERIRELEADRDEWKQCAGVEAKVRREFVAKTDELEAALAAARAKPIEKIALRDSPNAIEAFNWQSIRDEFFPVLRQGLGIVDLKPPLAMPEGLPEGPWVAVPDYHNGWTVITDDGQGTTVAAKLREAIARAIASLPDLYAQLAKAIAMADELWIAREQIRGELDAARNKTIEECAKWLEDIPEHWRTLAADMRRALATGETKP